MELGGQGYRNARRLSLRPCSELDAQGFTMVVLLVVMAIMAIGMSALLPKWGQQNLREKEEELIFRGNQYARALVLYSRKNGNTLPSNIDVLYTGKYLRKKYKDPITGEDFGLLAAGQPPGTAGRGAPSGQQGTGQQGTGRGSQTSGAGRGSTGMGAPSGTQIVGQIQGVYSKSTDTSIRVYQNQQRYIDWPFTIQMAQLMMGRGVGPGVQQGPGRGDGRGDGRGNPTGLGRGDGRGGNPGRGIGPPGGQPGRGGPGPGGQPGRGGGPPVTGRGRGPSLR
jgi:type II secretory pathway pseudopilin PulG